MKSGKARLHLDPSSLPAPLASGPTALGVISRAPRQAAAPADAHWRTDWGSAARKRGQSKQRLLTETLPRDVLPIPWLTHVLALTHNRLAAQQDLIGAATYPHALVHVVVDVHEMGASGDLELAVGVEDHQITIAAN